MWLGELFTDLGCQAVPALHCRQAESLAKRLDLPITILVVNPKLPSAARTVKALVAANPDVRVVLIVDPADEPDTGNGNGRAHNGALLNPKRIPARSRLERPSPIDPISRPDWVAKVQKILCAAAERYS